MVEFKVDKIFLGTPQKYLPFSKHFKRIYLNYKVATIRSNVLITIYISENVDPALF